MVSAQQIIHLNLLDQYANLVGDQDLVTITTSDLNRFSNEVKKDYYIFSNNICVYTLHQSTNAISIDLLTDYQMFIQDTLFCCPEAQVESVNTSIIKGYLPQWKQSLTSEKSQKLLQEIEIFLEKSDNLSLDLSNIRDYQPPDPQIKIETTPFLESSSLETKSHCRNRSI